MSRRVETPRRVPPLGATSNRKIQRVDFSASRTESIPDNWFRLPNETARVVSLLEALHAAERALDGPFDAAASLRIDKAKAELEAFFAARRKS